MKQLPIIGLEVHIQLKTKTKLFCGCSIEYGVEPNKNICPICTGQPGVLPVINRKAVELAVKVAYALKCKIHNNSIFARKNYYYPDLPKNYQISQYEQPLATDGSLEVEVERDSKKDKCIKEILIKRIHLEEDAGKLLHAIGKEELNYSLVDYNRTGTPLIEVVTHPCIYSVEEAIAYLSTLRDVVRYLDVSDCDLEKGTFRVDANVSIGEVYDGFDGDYKKLKLGIKTELKNMNSFKAIKDALSYEIERQTEILSSGEKVVQQTRLWDENLGITQPMRSKEEAHDYRYFPDPDLLPIKLSENLIDEIKSIVIELPFQKKKRFIEMYGLSEYDSKILVSEKIIASYFEDTIEYYKKKYGEQNIQNTAKTVSNLIITEILGILNEENLDFSNNKIKFEHLSELVYFYNKGVLSSKLVKDVLLEIWESGLSPKDIVEQKGISQITDADQLKSIIEEVIKENQKIVEDYKLGRTQALSALMGQIMKKTKGKANPLQAQQIVKDLLKN